MSDPTVKFIACGDELERDEWRMVCSEPFGHEGAHAGPGVNVASSSVAMLEWAHPGEPAYDDPPDTYGLPFDEAFG